MTPDELIDACQRVLELSPDAVLVKNAVGNLAVMVDGVMVAWIDLGATVAEDIRTEVESLAQWRGQHRSYGQLGLLRHHAVAEELEHVAPAQSRNIGDPAVRQSHHPLDEPCAELLAAALTGLCRRGCWSAEDQFPASDG